MNDSELRYFDLNLHQRISLKGYFEQMPELEDYLLVMTLWGFIPAVNYFLSDDLSVLGDTLTTMRQRTSRFSRWNPSGSD
ncbi:hypothetical protein [Catalinimonas alkaloidigena]|uniref:hypothetical protein n=1 Tax=Catalinimonas alkaloidigena TaxID=1075417 RepID=UPI000B7E8BBB|nr:hypothetical protein [Catalinimonas alkaloidigena]